MYESISNILCLIGAIYLLYRIATFLKSLIQLIFKSRRAANKSTKNQISAL